MSHAPAVAHVNRIGTAVPDHDVHATFIAFADGLLPDRRTKLLFTRMAQRAEIEHRYSYLQPGETPSVAADRDGFYGRGVFPSTAARMARFQTYALDLATRATARLDIETVRSRISHLVVASCTGIANFCLLARRDLFDRIGRSWGALLADLLDRCPDLASCLAGSESLLERPLSISRIPYGFLHTPLDRDPNGLFRLGDQAGVIPSFCGDGIAIALHTGRLAAATYLARGNAAGDFHRQVRDDIGGQIRLASYLYGLSELPLGRSALVMLCRAFPGAMRALATSTRIPPTALQRVEAAVDRVAGSRSSRESVGEER